MSDSDDVMRFVGAGIERYEKARDTVVAFEREVRRQLDAGVDAATRRMSLPAPSSRRFRISPSGHSWMQTEVTLDTGAQPIRLQIGLWWHPAPAPDLPCVLFVGPLDTAPIGHEAYEGGRTVERIPSKERDYLYVIADSTIDVEQETAHLLTAVLRWVVAS